MPNTTARPIEITPRLVARLMDCFDPTEEGCWIWQGEVGNTGYGRLRVDRRSYLAHRVSYTLHVGSIPEGLVIDHLCRNPRCIKPAHLEPVPQRVNMMRGMAPTAQVLRSGYCARGHKRDDVDRFGDCRKCKNIRQADRRRELEAADPSLREERLSRNRHYYRLRRERGLPK